MAGYFAVFGLGVVTGVVGWSLAEMLLSAWEEWRR